MKPPRFTPTPLGLSVKPGSKLKTEVPKGRPAAGRGETEAYGLDALERDLNVSRETVERIVTHRRLLETWAAKINLMGPREFEDYWRRHALDCGQLVRLAPDARHWVDMGAGAGFPGVIVGCLLAGTAGAQIDLIEASAKKCAFLREAVRETGAPGRVQFSRIETAIPGRIPDCDVITARALAPLSRLIEHAKPLLDRGALGLFPKGADFEAELGAAGFVRDGGGYRRDDLIAEAVESASDPRARVIKLRPI